jgi:RecJ-like exonuclease
LGEEIPLELHHIDGNHFNNDLSNLMVLCPNCHAKTDSYRGKKNKKQAIKVCKYCGKEVSKWSKSLVCEECSHKHQRKVEWPSKETLEKLLEENSINAISIMYGVSFHTVKKWVKRYNLG